MDELRILLLGIGLVALALIYLWGMRKQIRERIAERRRRSQARVPENEPQIAGGEDRNPGDDDGIDVDVWSEAEIRVIKPAATAGQSPDFETGASESTDSEATASDPVAPTVSEPGVTDPDMAPRSGTREGLDDSGPPGPEPAESPQGMSHPRASRSADTRPSTDRSRSESPSPESTDARTPGSSSARSPDPGTGRHRSVDEMTVLLTVMAPSGQQLRGGAIRVACEASDLVLGEGGVWECRSEATEDQEMIFGIAHLREPGTFAGDTLNALQTPGLLLFMRLPGPLDPVPAVDLMIAVAGRLARRLGATVCDQKRNRMSTQAMIRLRAEAAEFERRIQASIDG